MYTHLLIATDGSELAGKAVAAGIALARSLNARVTALTVIEPFHVLTTDPAQLEETPASYARHAKDAAARTLGAVRKAAEAAGVACEVVDVEDDNPYQAIIATATQRSCDLIVMASHGRRGMTAVVLGSQTVKVLTHTTIPVLVCR